MARQRNYRAEYARRIARGLARGYTRSQARGHPGPSERYVSPVASVPAYDLRLEFGVRGIREGRTLTRMAGSLHVDPERLRAYALLTGAVERQGREFVVIDDQRLREVKTYTGGHERTIVLRGYAEAAKWGRYMSAVGRFLDTNDPIVLLPFENDVLTDVEGHQWPFEVRPNVLYRLSLTTEDPSVQLYRIVVAS